MYVYVQYTHPLFYAALAALAHFMLGSKMFKLQDLQKSMFNSGLSAIDSRENVCISPARGVAMWPYQPSTTLFLSSDFFNQPKLKPPHNNPRHLHHWMQISPTQFFFHSVQLWCPSVTVAASKVNDRPPALSGQDSAALLRYCS